VLVPLMPTVLVYSPFWTLPPQQATTVVPVSPSWTPPRNEEKGTEQAPPDWAEQVPPGWAGSARPAGAPQNRAGVVGQAYPTENSTSRWAIVSGRAVRGQWARETPRHWTPIVREVEQSSQAAVWAHSQRE
jgi:hypothetical protein